jgi:putative ATP-binding cassette transporter
VSEAASPPGLPATGTTETSAGVDRTTDHEPVAAESTLSLFLLLGRLPASALALTVAVGLAAGGAFICAYHFGFGQDTVVRRWHGAASIIAVVTSLVGYLLFQAWFRRRTWRHYEEAVAGIRANIVRLAATSELPVLRGVGDARFAAILDGDARVVLSSVTNLTLAMTFSALVVTGAIWVALQSLTAFGLFLVAIVAFQAFRSRHGRIQPMLALAAAPESRFRAVLADILAAPKQLLLNRRVGQDAAAHAERSERAGAEVRRAAGAAYAVSVTVVQVLSALFQIALLELAHGIVPGTRVPIEIVMLLATLQGMTAWILLVQEEHHSAAAAARRLMALEAGLAVAPRVRASRGSLRAFQCIRLEQVQLGRGRRDETGGEFVLGPADLTVTRGTVTIMRGGNGSGKTTLLEILLGLLKPGAGRISVDGIELDTNNLESYRALFSPVFANPFLFDRLYGYRDHDAALGREWLERLALPPDVDLHASSRQTAALSTGQRKRLALARALIEDRPILVLDEYTADQDVEARRQFYEDVLPRLKAMGRTVVAVVHEDVRPACADQILRVEDGRVSVELPGS